MSPTEGPLHEMLQKSGNNPKLLAKLFLEKYFTDIANFLNLLRDIKSFLHVKKHIKRVQKFEHMVESKKYINCLIHHIKPRSTQT